MKIRPFTNLLKTSPVFKTVRFSRDLPEISTFEPSQLPAVYILPASTRGTLESGDFGLHQENVEIYAFAIITKAPDPNGTDEPLDEAIGELRRLLFGFQPTPELAPLNLGEGDLFDLSTKAAAWLETFVTRRVYRV